MNAVSKGKNKPLYVLQKRNGTVVMTTRYKEILVALMKNPHFPTGRYTLVTYERTKEKKV